MALTIHTNVGFVAVAPTADPDGTAATSDGSSFVVKDTAPTGAVKIVEVGWYKASGTTSSNCQVGLYADSAGVAATRLQVTGDAASGTSAGWIRFTGLNWTITPSTAYWLGMQHDAHTGTSQIDSASSGGAGIDTRTSQTALTDPYGGGAVSDADGMYAIYAVYQIAPTVALTTPTDTATGQSVTPNLIFTGTDSNGDEVEYEVQVAAAAFNDMTCAVLNTGNFNTTGEQTISLTISAGSNKGLLVGYICYDPTEADRSTTVTWNGTNVPSIALLDTGGDGNRCQYFFLPSPTTGTHNLVITPAGTVDNFAYCAYDLTNCSATPNEKIETTKGASSPWSSDITPTKNGCIIFGATNFGPGIVLTTGQTLDGHYYSDYSTFSHYQHSSGTYAFGGTCTGTDVGPFALISIAPYVEIIHDVLSSTEDPTHFSGTGDPHPWPSGNAITYAVQAAVNLQASTTYYWRVRAIDPTGSNTWGAYPTAFSFTTAAEGGATVVKDLIMMGIIPFPR
jgi:hypothetical protein